MIRSRLPLGLLPMLLLIPTALRAQESAEPAPCPCCAPLPEAVKDITAREIGMHMGFLASDLLRGRDTASPEIRLAAEYLATRLQGFGAEPAGDPERAGQSYFQRFPLDVVTPKEEGISLSLVVEQDDARKVLPWTLEADYSTFPAGIAPGEIEAPVVFAGHGVVDERAGIDDYEDLEVKDRFVLVLDGSSGGRGSRNATPFAKRASVLKRGALGLIVMRPPGEPVGPVAEPRQPSVSVFGRPRMTLGAAPTSIPVINLRQSASTALARAGSIDTEDLEPRELNGVRLRFTFEAERESKVDRNVLGLFPGSDDDLKKEVIVFSAHYDHVGVNERGEIFNGSDDNASGTSALLEIAEAFGDGPRPRRSVLFLWVSGEEKGLFGSEWFAEHPTLPDDYKIVANINLDMVSRNDAGEVGVTPSEKHPDYSTLIPASVAALKDEGVEAKFNADQFYARTDSYNFAKRGIPVVFYFSGIHDDYHQPSDTVDKADFEKAAKIARAAYRVGWEMGQADEAPRKIKDEEAAGEKAED